MGGSRGTALWSLLPEHMERVPPIHMEGSRPFYFLDPHVVTREGGGSRLVSVMDENSNRYLGIKLQGDKASISWAYIPCPSDN